VDFEASTVGPLSAKPRRNASFGPLKQIDVGLLDVGYTEAGLQMSSTFVLRQTASRKLPTQNVDTMDTDFC
jgi:hypothetical protein